MDLLTSIWEQIARSGPDQWMAWGSALVALVSFVLNWRLVQRQERRNATSLKLAHDSDVIRWSDEVIFALAEATEMLSDKGVAYPDQDFRLARSQLRARVSALIDRGRLFFPNKDTGDGHGLDKSDAFKGHRQPALDALVQAYDVLGRAGDAPGPDDEAATKLRTIRRAFVAEIFGAIDPVRRGMTLKELSA